MKSKLLNGISGAAIATVTLSLLAGCTLGPDFKKPAAPQADGYTAQPLPAKTDSAKVAGGNAQEFVRAMDIPGQWWTLFHSDALNTLIEEALRANPSLQAAQASLRQARENLYVGNGALMPVVTASGGITREKEPEALTGFGVSPAFNLYNASVAVSYNVDVFGGEKRQIESLEAQAEFQRFQVESSYLTLTSNVVTAAVSEASLRAQIQATEDIIGSEEEALTVLRNQFNLGGTSRSDVLAQEAAVAQAKATLPLLTSQLTQTQNQLAALAGRLPNQKQSEIFDLASLQLPPQLPVTLPSKLVEQRPDVRAAEEQLHAASAQIGVARAAQFPNFGISAQFGADALQPNEFFGAPAMLASIGGSVTQTLFDGDQLYHKKEAAIAAYDATEATYRSTVLQAFENVANALRALEFDAEALRAQLAAEQSAADSLSISRSQYQNGAITYILLLNAEQQYQTARINLVKAQATRYADTAALFQALGGGWWNRKDVAAPSDAAQ
ncbi:MAG TPA: efflux transporter outer membrane subunit [Magnetospirillaceae bacterium]|jgi:NodT family efflux transporter outer membrane factor (OMF) lipoprotein